MRTIWTKDLPSTPRANPHPAVPSPVPPPVPARLRRSPAERPEVHDAGRPVVQTQLSEVQLIRLQALPGRGPKPVGIHRIPPGEANELQLLELILGVCSVPHPIPSLKAGDP